MGFDLALSLALRALPFLRRIWPYLGFAIVGGLLYLWGHSNAADKAELKAARDTIVVLEETARRNALAAAMATQAANRRAVNEQNLQTKVEAYEDELKARGRAECLLDDDDVVRLRDLK